MATSFEEATEALYRAPHEAFTSERQRIAAELKAAGDKAGAQRVTKLSRPSITAWAVNQLWWQARPAFEQLFETASELRQGKLAGRDAHRKALARLSARARELLAGSGHAASEASIRRIEMTLAGLAAAGGFEPDLPGALLKDREPPGFEAFGEASFSDAQPVAPERAQPSRAKLVQAHAEAEAERRRVAQERAKKLSERKKLESALHEAKQALADREAAYERAKRAALAAEEELEEAQREVEKSKRELAAAD